LYMTSTLVTPAIADVVARLPIERISLSKTAVDEKAVRKIAEITSVAYMDINGCEKISNAVRLRLEHDFPTISFEPKICSALTLRESAKTRIERGDFRGALVEFQQCANMQEKRYGKDSPRLIPINVNIAASEMALGQFKEAQQVLNRTMPICERAGTPYDVLAVTDQLSNLYVAIDIDKALPNALKGLKLAEQLNARPDEVANRCFIVGDLSFGRQRYKDAEAFYRRSLAITEKTKGANSRPLGRVLIHLAEALRLQARHTDSASYYQSAIEILDRADSTDSEKTDIGIAYTGLAAIKLANREPSESLKNSDRAEAFFRTCTNPAILSTHHFQRALILDQLGRVKEAQVERDAVSRLNSQAGKSK